MPQLETYNRVATLESQAVRRLLIAGYVVLLLGAILGLVSYLLLPRPWPFTVALPLVALIACAALLVYDSRRQRRCRFCGSALRPVTRPLFLTQRYLAMEGHKNGDYFFTRKKRAGFGSPRWVKLSNQSLACHHCRITEEKSRVIEETPDAGEVEALRANTAPSQVDQ